MLGIEGSDAEMKREWHFISFMWLIGQRFITSRWCLTINCPKTS